MECCCYGGFVLLLLALLLVTAIADGAIQITVTSPHIDRSNLTLRVPYGFRGTIAQCTTSEPQAREVEWQQNGLSLVSNIISADFEDDENPALLGEELFSDSGFFQPDIGSYTCVVRKNSTSILDMKVISLKRTDISSKGSACSIVTDSINFEFRVLETNCEAFKGYRFPIRFEFTNELILAVSGQCPGCAVSQNEITINNGPLCSTKVEEATLFHGTISTTDKSRTSSILCALRGWQQTRPLVMLNDTLYYVDEKCGLIMMKNATTMLEECGIEEGRVQFFLYIVGGVTGVLLICLLTCACMFVTFKNGRPQLCCAQYSKTKSASSRRQHSTSLIRQITSKKKSSPGLEYYGNQHHGSRRSSRKSKSSQASSRKSPHKSDSRPLRGTFKGSRDRGSRGKSTSEYLKAHSTKYKGVSQDTLSSISSQWSTGIMERKGDLVAVSQPLLGQHSVKRDDSIPRRRGNSSLPLLSRYQSETFSVFMEETLPQHHSMVVSEPSDHTQLQSKASAVAAPDPEPISQHLSQTSITLSEHHSQTSLTSVVAEVKESPSSAMEHEAMGTNSSLHPQATGSPEHNLEATVMAENNSLKTAEVAIVIQQDSQTLLTSCPQAHQDIESPFSSSEAPATTDYSTSLENSTQNTETPEISVQHATSETVTPEEEEQKDQDHTATGSP